MNPNPSAAVCAIPQALRNLRRWCTWRLEFPAGAKRPTKVPDQSTLNLSQCRSWARLAGSELTPQGGIGLVMTGQPRLDVYRVLALDLDSCVSEDRTLAPWAQRVVDAMQSYTEISPSGRGLRIFFLVQPDLPKLRALAKIAAPGTMDKAPQAQLFGLGPAGYVTVTGDHLLGTPLELRRETPADVLVDLMGLASDEIDVELPVGAGSPPSLEEITGEIAASQHGLALIGGRWKEVVKSSASEAFFMLTQRAVTAARGHGERAIDWLLKATAWGRGQIDDCRDPAKYTRRDWVARDVARSFSRGSAAAAVADFAPLDDGAPFEAIPEDGRAPSLPVPALLERHTEFVANANAQSWLVKGLIPRTGLVQMFGDPGSGKTPFAMSLMLHVAAGKPTWFGRKIARHGKAVYMIGEDAHGLRWRAIAEQQRMELRTEDLGDQVYWSKQPGQLTDAEDAKRWLQQLQAVGPIAMLLVDTQSRNFGAGDENSTQDMAKFVHHLAELGRILQCCVILVHHTGHANKDRGRGSMVMFGALDGCWRITNEGTTVTATATKCKNWATPEPLVGQLVPQVLGHDEDGDAITAITLVTEPPAPDAGFGPIPPVDDVLDRLLRAASELQGDWTSYSLIGERAGSLSRSTTQRRMAELVELGLVEIVKSSARRGVVLRVTERGAALLLAS